MNKKIKSVEEFISTVVRSIEARQAKFDKGTPKPQGPLFTFLVGSGFSITAGISSVNHLICSLEEFNNDSSQRWFDIFEKSKDRSPQAKGLSWPELTDHYFNLMDEVLPLPQSRHDFITAAIQWASSKKVQMNVEGILLATILMAGSGNNVALKSGKKNRHWLSKAFARHVFTTNFDEVLPNTFYLGNQPVEIIDTPGIRDISTAAEYPTIIYLHGRHLHFDIRNTRLELHAKGDQNDQKEDLFDGFRRMLKHTGLIVIGYSGAKDKVTEIIFDALKDANSLPYGLWWTAYRDEDAVLEDVRQMIKSNERAYLLDPGKDAEQVTRELCRQIGIDDLAALGRWQNRLKVIASEVNRFLERASYDFRQFQLDATQALFLQEEEEIINLLNTWRDMEKHLLDHNDDEFVGDLHVLAGKLMMSIGKESDAKSAFFRATSLFEKIEKKNKVADVLLATSELLLLEGALEEAEDKLLICLDNFKTNKKELGISKVLGFLGLKELRNKNYEKSESYFSQALEINARLNYELGIGDNHFGIASIHFAQSNYTTAIDEASKALEYHNNDGAEIKMIQDQRLIGLCHLHLRKFDKAEEFLVQSFEKSQKTKNGREIAYGFLAIAEFYYYNSKIVEAKKHYDKSKSFFNSHFDAIGNVELERIKNLLFKNNK